MAKTIQLTGQVKIITTGNKPTTTNLKKGEMAFGKVDGRKRLYGSEGAEVIELTAYDSTEADDVATVEGLGGIPAGTKASELKGKSTSEILDALLFPVVNPTFTAPSATISLKSTSATPVLQEVGADGSTVPTTESFNYTFNKGAINIAGTKKQDRAGAETSHEFLCSVNNASETSELPSILNVRGQYKYRVKVSYAAGPQPLDSKGGEYGEPLAAGSVQSSQVIINAEYPYYANTVSVAQLTKQPLITNSYLEVECVSETSEGRHQFAIPAAYTVTKIEYFDTVANKYNPMEVTDFTAESYEQDVQGRPVSYKKYVRNTSGLSGATKFKITFTKA